MEEVFHSFFINNKNYFYDYNALENLPKPDHNTLTAKPQVILSKNQKKIDISIINPPENTQNLAIYALRLNTTILNAKKQSTWTHHANEEKDQSSTTPFDTAYPLLSNLHGFGSGLLFRQTSPILYGLSDQQLDGSNYLSQSFIQTEFTLNDNVYSIDLKDWIMPMIKPYHIQIPLKVKFYSIEGYQLCDSSSRSFAFYKKNNDNDFEKTTGTISNGQYIFGFLDGDTLHAINNTEMENFCCSTDISVDNNILINSPKNTIWQYDEIEKSLTSTQNQTKSLHYSSQSINVSSETPKSQFNIQDNNDGDYNFNFYLEYINDKQVWSITKNNNELTTSKKTIIGKYLDTILIKNNNDTNFWDFLNQIYLIPPSGSLEDYVKNIIQQQLENTFDWSNVSSQSQMVIEPSTINWNTDAYFKLHIYNYSYPQIIGCRNQISLKTMGRDSKDNEVPQNIYFKFALVNTVTGEIYSISSDTLIIGIQKPSKIQKWLKKDEHRSYVFTMHKFPIELLYYKIV